MRLEYIYSRWFTQQSCFLMKSCQNCKIIKQEDKWHIGTYRMASDNLNLKSSFVKAHKILNIIKYSMLQRQWLKNTQWTDSYLYQFRHGQHYSAAESSLSMLLMVCFQAISLSFCETTCIVGQIRRDEVHAVKLTESWFNTAWRKSYHIENFDVAVVLNNRYTV